MWERGEGVGESGKEWYFCLSVGKSGKRGKEWVGFIKPRKEQGLKESNDHAQVDNN